MDEIGKRMEIIDEEDKKLKNLKTDLGDEVYKVVTTSLMELNEHNSSGRYRIQELWNFKAGRKATLKEGVAYILKQWNALKEHEAEKKLKVKGLSFEEFTAHNELFEGLFTKKRRKAKMEETNVLYLLVTQLEGISESLFYASSPLKQKDI